MFPAAEPAMATLARATLPDRAGSFAERGVAVPFTAPLLAGARFRLGPRQAPELLLPSPGGRGVFVLAWSAALEACAPSLHDRRLWQRLSALEEVLPAHVRAAARLTAAEGLAGREAAAAAATALREAEAARRAARVRLAQVLPGPAAEACLDGAAEALAAIWPGAGLARGVEGPLARLAARLARMLEELEAWLPEAPPAAQRPAQLLLAGGGLGAAAARGALSAVPEGLARLAAGGLPLDGLTALLRRPDWLLDGWDGLLAVWDLGGPARREEAVAEMAGLMPIPPLEVEGWPGPAADWDRVQRLRRLVAPRPAWARCGLTDMVARNERIRALAA